MISYGTSSSLDFFSKSYDLNSSEMQWISTAVIPFFGSEYWTPQTNEDNVPTSKLLLSILLRDDKGMVSLGHDIPSQSFTKSFILVNLLLMWEGGDFLSGHSLVSQVSTLRIRVCWPLRGARYLVVYSCGIHFLSFSISHNLRICIKHHKTTWFGATLFLCRQKFPLNKWTKVTKAALLPEVLLWTSIPLSARHGCGFAPAATPSASLCPNWTLQEWLQNGPVVACGG